MLDHQPDALNTRGDMTYGFIGRKAEASVAKSDGAVRYDRDGATNAGVLVAEAVTAPIAARGAVLAATLISDLRWRLACERSVWLRR